jgi:hypothetical protein
MFGDSRGRRRSRVALLQRSFGFISVLAFVSLGGFRTNRSRINLDWPFLGKMRTRNQNLMVLQKSIPQKKVSVKQCTTQENGEQQSILSSDKAHDTSQTYL